MLLAVVGLTLSQAALAIEEQLAKLNRLCRELIDAGNYPEASSVCGRVSFDIKKLASGSPQHIVSLVGLADLKRRQENNVSADALYAEALGYIDQRDPDSFEAATLLDLQAESKIGRGKLLEAEPLLRRALAIREKQHGADAPDVAETRVRYANVLSMTAQYQKAHIAYRSALVVFQNGGMATRNAYLDTRRRLAEVMERESRFEQAQTEYLQLLADAQGAPPARGSVALALDRLGWIASQDGRGTDATDFYRRELAELKAASANRETIAALEARLAALTASTAAP